jgi:exodeoxyribonuclease-3
LARVFTLATWNVNSLRAREPRVLDWLRRAGPAVVCLQETKVTDDKFPIEPFRQLGYEVVMAGQKTYNGVAIASRLPLSDVQVGLSDPRPDDGQRLISAVAGGVRVYCVYVPNGKSVDSPDFARKLDWLRRLRATLDVGADPRSDVAVCGDFNIAPQARDVYDPEAYAGQLHFHPDEHAVLAQLTAFGLRDALRVVDDAHARYTWWDYRAGAFRRDKGLRIDHLLISESLAARCTEVVIHREERALSKPSDHAPVLASFD